MILPENISYCVIGDPVEHSVSPVMQNAAFSRLGMGTPYGKICVKKTEIAAFFDYARKNLRGVNVTVPLKEEAAKYADQLAPSARQSFSVNTLVIADGVVTGHSTDGCGLLRALEKNLSFCPAGKKILFLGAGGAARAGSFALAEAGAAQIRFLNRSAARAGNLVEKLQEIFPSLVLDCAVFTDRKAVESFFGDADLVLQSTSLGWHAADPVVTEIPDTHAAFFDFVYRDTPFLREAARRHLPYADGRDMLLYQGAESFRLWTGKEAPIDAMRRALACL